MNKPIKADRNYNTISPSAKSLILLKGHTNIPYARETAELIAYPAKYYPDLNKRDYTFWGRIMHFEHRYLSIDNLLADLSVYNVLELSSGFSFRGLEAIKNERTHYIDTDLPDLISAKKKLYADLVDKNTDTHGKLEILSLNALDKEQFDITVSHFPEGEIVIINEGLLMYLDIDEKKKLCENIHSVLKERGGFWITADIYIKSQKENSDFKFEDKTKKFSATHRIEENKFESFKEAELFFSRMGFIIDKEANNPYSGLSSIQYFIKSATPEQLLNIRTADKTHATWRLKIASDVSSESKPI